MAVEKEKICERCFKPYKTFHNNQKYCQDCRPLVKEEYLIAYRKVYNATRRFDTTIKKRNYTRTKLKNQTRKEIDDIVLYCKENCHTVEGCLNCPARDCIQPESADEFLIWEKEEGFYEENYIK